ncbi:MAG: hypothetical protein JSV64_02690, partial [Candidatus Bathyarchaeota archaeon]
ISAAFEQLSEKRVCLDYEPPSIAPNLLALSYFTFLNRYLTRSRHTSCHLLRVEGLTVPEV